MGRVCASVWPAIVVHAIGNDALGFSGQMSIVEVLTPYSQITRAAPMLALAALLIWFFWFFWVGNKPNKSPGDNRN